MLVAPLFLFILAPWLYLVHGSEVTNFSPSGCLNEYTDEISLLVPADFYSLTLKAEIDVPEYSARSSEHPNVTIVLQQVSFFLSHFNRFIRVTLPGLPLLILLWCVLFLRQLLRVRSITTEVYLILRGLLKKTAFFLLLTCF